MVKATTARITTTPMAVAVTTPAAVAAVWTMTDLLQASCGRMRHWKQENQQRLRGRPRLVWCVYSKQRLELQTRNSLLFLTVTALTCFSFIVYFCLFLCELLPLFAGISHCPRSDEPPSLRLDYGSYASARRASVADARPRPGKEICAHIIYERRSIASRRK